MPLPNLSASVSFLPFNLSAARQEKPYANLEIPQETKSYRTIFLRINAVLSIQLSAPAFEKK
jgi:hypothetical protein